jgi:selenocysteine-specific elongation factor
MPREELRSRLGLAPRQAEIVLSGLAVQGVLSFAGSRVAKTGFEPRLSAEDARRLADLRARFEASPSSPPSIRECREALGDELWSLLTIQGEFVEISEDVAFEATAYRRIVGEITTSLERGGSVTVAEVRDRYQTSRKYALALLEHMDAIGVTVRVGDERRLKPGGNQNPGSPSG